MWNLIHTAHFHIQFHSGLLAVPQPKRNFESAPLFFCRRCLSQQGSGEGEDDAVAVKRIVDLVFLVDVTGSMKPCIDGLKDSIDKFFAYLTNDSENECSIKEWRAKVVGYRDVKFDKDQWIVENPFVTTADEVHAQLKGLVAKGGGDEPESLLDALMVVANMGETGIQDVEDPMKWRPHAQAARAVVVFTDATYHPEAALEKYEGCTYEDIARKIAEQRIILEIITPVNPSDKSVRHEDFEDCYRNLAMAQGAEYCPLVTEQGEELSFNDIPTHTSLFVRFMEQLAKTVSKSIEPPEL